MNERRSFFSKFIDLDGVWSDARTPSLKTVFDNLRNYPVLAIFYLVAQQMALLQLPWGKQFHYVLLGFLIFFTIATFIQTALLLTGLVIGFLFGLMPKRWIPKEEGVVVLFAVLFGCFFFFCFLLAFVIFIAIQKV